MKTQSSAFGGTFMDISKVKIVTDSSANITGLSDVDFAVAPLKIITAEREYFDDSRLDVGNMVEELDSYNGRSSTSCPNAGEWLRAFGDAEYVFCITLTGALSGSYNSAMMAKDIYIEQNPNCRVFVLNSLTAGPQIGLIVDRLVELVKTEDDFDEICEKITRYRKKTGLMFILSSMKNLANNGRISQLTSKMAGILNIRAVGKASDRGEFEPLDKCHGEIKALHSVIEQLKAHGLNKGRVIISHCLNPRAAEALKAELIARFGELRVEISECRGLCSFYAEKGGLLIGYEKI